ncbi:SLAP domain-containing protein [Lactobacillus crispatus]
MKKSIKCSSVIVAALMAVAPIATNAVSGQHNIVQAASSSRKLKGTAVVYSLNKKGKLVSNKKSLKKGQSVKVLGYKEIGGKKYARIGKNQYVKISTLRSTTRKNYQVNRKSYVYDKDGNRIKGTKAIEKNTKIHVIRIKGNLAQIGKNRFIKIKNISKISQPNKQNNSDKGQSNVPGTPVANGSQASGNTQGSTQSGNAQTSTSSNSQPSSSSSTDLSGGSQGSQTGNDSSQSTSGSQTGDSSSQGNSGSQSGSSSSQTGDESSKGNSGSKDTNKDNEKPDGCPYTWKQLKDDDISWPFTAEMFLPSKDEGVWSEATAEQKAEMTKAAEDLAKHAYFLGEYDPEDEDGLTLSDDIVANIVYKANGLYLNKDRGNGSLLDDAVSYKNIPAGTKSTLGDVCVTMEFDPFTRKPEVVINFDSTYEVERYIPYKNITFVDKSSDFKGIDLDDEEGDMIDAPINGDLNNN